MCMDEKRIQRRLKITVILVAATGIVLLAATGFFGWFLWGSLNQAVSRQMAVTADKYVNLLQNQMHADFQLLDTISSLAGNKEFRDGDDFQDVLYETVRRNDLITMGYYAVSGEGVEAAQDKRAETVSLEQCTKEQKEAVYAVFGGEKSASELVDGHISGEKVIVYAVPVIEDDKIIGALCARGSSGILEEIRTGKPSALDGVSISLVDENGEFLIPSEASGVKAGADTLLRPAGVNGWRLLCTSSVWELKGGILPLAGAAMAGFAGMLVLILFWLQYCYRKMRENAAELFGLAFYDQLTGAYNFDRFRQRAEAECRKNNSCTLVSLNIHQFKFINEIFGKDHADQVLKYVADMISGSLNEGEIFCRESADFFYIFLRDTDRDRVRGRLEEIMAAVSGHGRKGQGGHHILLYCGAVISDETKIPYHMEQMLTHVMFALEKAGETHQNNVWFFDSKLHEKERMDNYVERHMYQALQDEEFLLYLQAKTDLKTGLIGGAEALVRWAGKDGEMIYPDQFIPVFEANGFCTKLDLYMVEKACMCIRGWIDQGMEPLPISVNQSKSLIYKADYIKEMREIIDRCHIPAELVTLEILEGAALENVEEFNETIRALQAEGFQISMDDFGSGYSSLNVLGQLQIDELKLDRAFLNEVTAGRNDKAGLIMQQIIELSKKLQIRTVVEGVETAENDRMIREWGCDMGQGYYYGEPCSAEAFTEKYMKKK